MKRTTNQLAPVSRRLITECKTSANRRKTTGVYFRWHCSIGPGTRAVVDIPFGKLYTHTELNIGAHVVHGKRPGPVLLITAALHGDEINGVEICRRLLRLPKLNSLKGTLVVVPIVNTYGFVQQSHVIYRIDAI
ncbi:MAG: succinylglutamate desuccinylase/aspartoacylase family protein [Rheinheimera sp.]|nr:succinylglutamate desuccinylase/aspartoacylase family protein [Rheinheimera sp.]